MPTSPTISNRERMQEVYVDAAARIQHFNQHHSGSFLIWLRLITDQTMANLYRRHLETKMRDVRRDISINGGQTTVTPNRPITMQLVCRTTSPSQVFMLRESKHKLRQSIARLKPIDQEVIKLRHLRMLDNKDVAAVLGINEKAASIRYVRAIRRLKEIMEQEKDESTVVRNQTYSDRDPFHGYDAISTKH